MDKECEERLKEKLESIVSNAPEELKRAIKIACEKGASSWVTAPSFDHQTVLHKGEFVDAICIRYGWELRDLPTTCACGASFSVQHSLDCQLGGYRTIQHNEVRDVLEAGHPSVEVEPKLQALSGEAFDYKSAIKDSDARSDLKVSDFWEQHAIGLF